MDIECLAYSDFTAGSSDNVKKLHHQCDWHAGYTVACDKHCEIIHWNFRLWDVFKFQKYLLVS